MKATTLRVLFLATSVIVAAACAQTPARQLPVDFIGTWEPNSRVYEGFGNLSVGANELSWNECSDVPSTVTPVDDAYVVEFKPGPCSGEPWSDFLIMQVSNREMQLWICEDPSQFERSERRRSCTWGTLGKQE